MLSSEQINRFHNDGYLVVEQAVTPEQLANLSRDFNQWVEESREHSEAYGESASGRPRFDLEPGHTSQSPALRRVTCPSEISPAYYDVVKNSVIPDAVAQLIGPNIKFHHCKINSKLPGAKTEVKYHQDFLYAPHSNDSLITALLFVDEVTMDNGPLEVVPGSHKGPLYSLWHDSVFTGAIDEDFEKSLKSKIKSCIGPAGTVCLMHTRLLHGSAVNLSQNSRTLFIIIYTAEDSVRLSPNPLPNRFEGEIIRGERTNRVRCSDYEMEIPEMPTGASFFSQQAKTS